jgi:hypothetical protein
MAWYGWTWCLPRIVAIFGSKRSKCAYQGDWARYIKKLYACRSWGLHGDIFEGCRFLGWVYYKSTFRRNMSPAILGYKTESIKNRLILFLARVFCSTLKIEVRYSSETSGYNEPRLRHIPEDGIVQVLRSSFPSPEEILWYCIIDDGVSGKVDLEERVWSCRSN